jgi:hypothetical protein
MRPSRRLHLLFQATLLAICFVACSRVLFAQGSTRLPQQWNDAVSQLADKIAAAMSPTTPVKLDVESISSLDASYVAAVGAALRNQLQAHSFSVASPNSAAAQSAVQLRLTLSESAADYVWVIQAVNDSPDVKPIPPMIVSVAKSDFTETEPNEQPLTLDKRFVWQQPQKFLDFALLPGTAPGQALLLVLESMRLVTYKQSGSGWQLFHTASIPPTRVSSRDPDGTIDIKDGSISVGGFECVGDPDLMGALRCHPAKPDNWLVTWIKTPGLPNSVGIRVLGRCRSEFISLYSGEGDWTQKDSIRGYLVNLNPIVAAAPGDGLPLDGPVLSLAQEPDATAARAIVHNLKTGNYEGYIVTATCSH